MFVFLKSYCFVWFFAGQHRSYAFKKLLGELGEEDFYAQITNSFTIGIFDCMPKQAARFINFFEVRHTPDLHNKR